jgi:hypothetical protein
MKELLEKIGGLLKKKSIADSFSRAVVDQYSLKQDSDETAINEAVDKFVGFHRTYIQPEADRRAKGAVKTFVEKHNLNEDGTKKEDSKPTVVNPTTVKPAVVKPDGDDKKNKEDEIPDSLKALLEQQNAIIKGLSEKLESVEHAHKTIGALDEGKRLFNESDVIKKLDTKLQKRLIKRLDPDSETSMQDQITELEDEAKEMIEVFHAEYLENTDRYVPQMPANASVDDMIKIMNGEENAGSNVGKVDINFPGEAKND